MNYSDFLIRKSQVGTACGFEPVWMPSVLMPFQAYLTDWNIRRGRAATFADCGMGKTLLFLVWGENVVRKTNKPVLAITTLGDSAQTIQEATKFGVDAVRSKDGTMPSSAKIVVTNYENIGKFNPSDFSGAICNESSILKNFQGTRRKQITRFLSKMPYRFLCTATPSPNDYVELGTSSEALGELNYSEMLRRFFRQLDDKGQKKERRQQERAEALIEQDPNYYRKLSYRVAQTIGQWRLKNHAIQSFWRWVTSWSRACRMPSDLGFANDGFVLPELREKDHIIKPKTPPPGYLFTTPAVGMREERAERRRTLTDRCEYVAGLVNHDRTAVVWCDMISEGKLLNKLIPDAEEISGSTPDDRKEELYAAFASGQLRVLVTKGKICGHGLNWQHCAHVVMFATHSYERYYQMVRRCWRFGQKNPVNLDVVATEGEIRVLGNMRSKAKKADTMFSFLVREMNDSLQIEREDLYTNRMEAPSWLKRA